MMEEHGQEQAQGAQQPQQQPETEEKIEFKNVTKLSTPTAVVVGSILLLLGGLLSMTCVGAVIGLPMAAAGILLPILSIDMSAEEIQKAKEQARQPKVREGLFSYLVDDECPYCGEWLRNMCGKTHKCPVCKQRIVIRDGQFLTVEQAMEEKARRDKPDEQKED